MNTTTIQDERREKIKKLREYHQATLDGLGVSDAYFLPKLAYIPRGKTEKFLAFFPSELNKGNDVFAEFCDIDNEPEDSNRTLYRWKYNSHFSEEYEKTELSSTGAFRYLVPVAELIVVKYIEPKTIKTINDIKETQINIPFEDIEENTVSLSNESIRDLAAILLNKPVSNKEWLNDIIKEGRTKQ